MIRHLFLIIFVIAGGVGASQLPNFVRAYEQRLGGALGEVQKLVDAFTVQAQDEGLSFEELVARHRESDDSAVRGTADRMTALAMRRGQLTAEMAALSAAPGSFDKMVVMAQGSDSELLRDTLSAYEITATMDPLFGGAGVLTGWGLFGIFGAMFRRRDKRGRRMPPGGSALR